VESANLVLTSTQAQRAEVVEVLVRANRYTFALKEFAHLAEYELSQRETAQSQNLTDRLVETLGLRGYATLDLDQDIADPYRKADVAFDKASIETQNSLKQLVKWLR
jgi:protein-tyrosine-phosphatase